MISDVFREILDVYEDEKITDFKDNTFALKFQKEVSAVISSNIEDSFIVKASCGHNAWCDYPWTNIIHGRYDNHQEALVIEYRFDSKNSDLYLSLIPRLEDYSQYVSVKEKLRNIIEKIEVFSFEVPDEDSFSILTKKYSYDELDNFTLVSDLEYIISIEEKLAPYFSAFLRKENSIVNKALLDMDYMCDMDAECCDVISRVHIIDVKTKYERKKKFINSINDPNHLFTDRVINEINLSYLSDLDYKEILSEIRRDSKDKMQELIEENNLSLDDLFIKDKVILLSKSFTDTEYKSVGRQLGSYSFNKIRVDDRLSEPLIITSLIHELSHFILERILKEALMKIIKTNDTPLISSFVKILLEDNDLNYLMDEYCAHTVEGRFALYGYQDYSSFKYKLDEISHMYSSDDIDFTLIVANTFAYDIKDILEDFIDEDLRGEIKEEFRYIGDNPNYDALDFEIESRLDYAQLADEIKFILISGFSQALSQMEKLERYMAKYSELYQ